MNEMTNDPRLKAFCSPNATDIFSAVVNATEIWKEDPFDVEDIHKDTREDFQALIAKSTTKLSPGKIFLILGESGAGKTHLMRYFRKHLHGQGLGYFGYMQLTSPSEDYGSYVLSHLIDSLNQPYNNSSSEISGMMRLSNAVAEAPQAMKKFVRIGKNRRAKLLTALREWEDLGGKSLANLIKLAVREIVKDPRFQGIDLNLLVAFLYLQVQDPFVKTLVLNYLRTQSLAPIYQENVPALCPSVSGMSSIQMIAELGKLMWATQNRSMVLCVDQLEGLLSRPNKESLFNQSLGTLVDIAAVVPSSVIVISCLDSEYDEIKDMLMISIRSKIEQFPGPKTLKSLLESKEHIQLLVGKRLNVLYDEMDVEYDESQPTFPIPEAEIDRCLKMRARHILELCGKFHKLAVKTGDIPKKLDMESSFTVTVDNAIEGKWQYFLMNWKEVPPVQDNDLASLLASGLTFLSEEIEISQPIHSHAKGRFIDAQVGVEKICIGICNKDTRGRGLNKEIKELEKRAGDQRMVIVRCTEFPKNPRSQIFSYIGDLITTKDARRTVVEDTEWRAFMAFPAFHKQNWQDPGFPEWQRNFRPLTRYASIQKILGLEGIGQLHLPDSSVESSRPTPEPHPATEASDSGSTQSSVTTVDKPNSKMPIEPDLETRGELLVGRTEGRKPQVITITTSELTQHAAFLGGTGSGKSTVAMNIIEQLLLQSVPIILVDRKGDLCSYANPEAWQGTLTKPELEARREHLSKAVDVKIYTPGHPMGRPLSISIVPEGTYLLQPYEREQIATFAAAALGNMMGLKTGGKDQACRGILKNAIYLLTDSNEPEEVTLQEILDLVDSKDASLVNMLGKLDIKLFDKLVQALETLRITRGELLKEQDFRLSADILLGLGSYKEPGKTRLSVISTKFLGDNLNVEFFISQLLLELSRWISKHPSDKLQAVVMFDEADIYLPATRKPSTKEPMEDLLKRARSGGLGVFLASQSPGDFDYKCKENIRSWFMGRIKEPTALSKLKPMLSQGQGDVGSLLAGQRTGHFHFVRDDRIDRILSDLSSISLKQLSEDQILKLARHRS